MDWGFPELNPNLPVLNTPEQFNLEIPELACTDCPSRYCTGYDFYIQYWWYSGCTDLDSATHFVSLDDTDFQYNAYDYAWEATQNWYSGTTIGYVEQERIDSDGEKLGYGCSGFTTYLSYPTQDVVIEGPSREVVGVHVPWNMLDDGDLVNEGGDSWEYLNISYATHWHEPAWEPYCDGKHSVFLTLHPQKPFSEVTLYRPDGTPYTEINTPILEHHLQEEDTFAGCSPHVRGSFTFNHSEIWFNGWPKSLTKLGNRHPYWN